MARAQVDKGAHGLDVCVALTERADEDQLMRKVVKRLANAVPVPLVIDTTEVDVLEAALKSNPGRSLINSTHLESGPEKPARSSPRQAVNAAVIVLTMTRTAWRRALTGKLKWQSGFITWR